MLKQIGLKQIGLKQIMLKLSLISINILKRWAMNVQNSIFDVQRNEVVESPKLSS